jgi:hypothetical protein
MKNFNKEEYNKICAEFLGWKEDFAHEIDKYGYIQTINGYMTPFINSGGHESNRSMYIYSTSQLKFDSDWNWIMEVCSKLKTLPYEEVKSQEYDNLSHLSIGISKKRVVQAIWEFLNWYKESKQ